MRQLVRDDDALLLYPEELIRLSGLGTAIAEIAAAPISVDDLSDELVERFGNPEGSSSKHATQAVIDELVERGVLEIL
ncbi:PqqD family peptide modification chaperone [Acidipropionibacterium jensenii]|uniref:PqqD family peptide modification chaperone n=1 Tax=Acidipropionibacterium jensenii TaxID=1749 RepID=UPI00214ACF8E|nr:PqqD family peptide modification chaperone [Acidipropionibacterium jensenii]